MQALLIDWCHCDNRQHGSTLRASSPAAPHTEDPTADSLSLWEWYFTVQNVSARLFAISPGT